jgi:diguanylate cyclase (GGDEF)-like protein
MNGLFQGGDMFLSLKLHFSLKAVEAEAAADQRIYRRALNVFVIRETTNSYLAQFIFSIVAISGYFLGMPSVLAIGTIHCLVDQLVRHNLGRLSQSLDRGELDLRRLGHIEHIFYIVGFVWAAAAWPLAETLDGFRLLLTVVSAAGLLVMASTTCFAPRVFQASVIGYAIGIAVAIPEIKTIPWYLLGGAAAAFLVVVMGVGAGTARQLIHMLEMQVERDGAIKGQESTIAALDLARRAATVMAETDHLTGLPNRFLCMTKLDSLIAARRQFSLTFLDVDLFKNINDALGHNIGDEVLKAIAVVLANFDDEFCFAARLGGDEFAVIAFSDQDRMSGAEIMRIVMSRVESLRKTKLNFPPISITGGSAYFPADADNRSDLLAAADMAQREAKKACCGEHLDYNTSLSDTFRRETQIALAINQAIGSHALSLHFQPKISLQTGRVVGAEALSRFSLQDLTDCSLEEIFEVAEKRGLGMILDELVLDRFREALVALRDEFSILMPISINLSGSILKTPERLLAKLNRMIEDGLQPSLIRIEITENAIYGRGQIGVIDLLNRIIKLGFSLALDDLGTGSGTLRHLVNLPISEIKIDRSFVSGMLSDRRNSAVVKGLIVTGRELGIDTVAEGVETEDQVDLLVLMGAQFAQGYLWSRPIPMPQFVNYIHLFGQNVRDEVADPPAKRLGGQFAGRA